MKKDGARLYQPGNIFLIAEVGLWAIRWLAAAVNHGSAMLQQMIPAMSQVNHFIPHPGIPRITDIAHRFWKVGHRIYGIDRRPVYVAHSKSIEVSDD